MAFEFDCTVDDRRQRGLRSAISALRRGEVVFLPVDTMYVLAVDPFSAKGVAALRAVKGRGRDLPLSVCVAGVRTVEGLMRNVYPLCTMGIAMGLHVRVGQEDNLWGRPGERATSVQQIERMVRISEELFRPIATAEQARRIYKLGEFYADADETLEKNGWLPNPPGYRPGGSMLVAA